MPKTSKSCQQWWDENTTATLPAKAEDEKGHANGGGHGVPDQGGGPAGTEVETEPEGGSQGQQLACHKVHLSGRKCMFMGLNIQVQYNIKQLAEHSHTPVTKWPWDEAFLAVFAGLLTDTNPLTVVNELDCGHRHKNHSVSVTQETQPEWTDNSMKPHDWGNTAVIHLIGVCLPGPKKIPGTDWPAASAGSQWCLPVCTRAQPSCLGSPGTTKLVPLGRKPYEYFPPYIKFQW